ncbi:unnamed protein product [Owenia fusiformis]|uniref:Uncharacterized protein n=1 Tax=Owenia fusiformis TaxID=6347 RepID=A0A8J1URI6_OWEFU|nr:unnamed protein product [Owenia fusiformis]
MMKYIIAVVALSCFVSCKVSAQGFNFVNCTAKEDGIYMQVSCTQYIECRDEVETIVNCPKGLVFDISDMRCEVRANVDPPCGDKMNCTGLTNDRYPYYDRNCTWYYTCRNEKMIGNAQECIPDTVFDILRQICTVPEDVCPPCGTGEGFVEPCPTDAPQHKVKANIDKMAAPEDVSLFSLEELKDLE